MYSLIHFGTNCVDLRTKYLDVIYVIELSIFLYMLFSTSYF